MPGSPSSVIAETQGCRRGRCLRGLVATGQSHRLDTTPPTEGANNQRSVLVARPRACQWGQGLSTPRSLLGSTIQGMPVPGLSGFVTSAQE